MKNNTLVAVGMALAAATAQAQAADATHCLKIEDPDDRLGCYDMEYGKTVSSSEVAGDWQLHSETNPLDDSETNILVLRADSGQSKWGKPVRLVIRCKSNTTDMWLTWQDYLGNDGPRVTTRLGSESAVTERWTLSTDNTSTFYPASPIGYIKKMMGQERFVAQVTPYNESPVTAVFNISGLESAVEPLRSNCNW